MISKFKAIVLSMFILSSLTACTASALYGVNLLAKFENYASYENISYGEGPLNQLNIYVPDQVTKRSNPATVVFFYGGCWGGCKVYHKEDYLFVAQALLAKGHIVVLADYRVYPQVLFAQIIEDASKTVEWVTSNIEKYGGDAQQIFLMGHSAGAHLGAMLTLNEKYLSAESFSSIQGFIGLAGAYDFLPFDEAYQKAVFAPPTSWPASQPINFVDGSESPLLLLHGENDQTVKIKNSKNLAKEIIKKGGQVKTHYYDLDHVEIIAALTIPLQKSHRVLADIDDFIKSILLKKSAMDALSAKEN